MINKNKTINESLVTSFVSLAIKTRSWKTLDKIKNIESVNIINKLANLDKISLKKEINIMLEIEKFRKNEKLMYLLGNLLKEFREYELAIKCFSYANEVNYNEIYIKNIAFLLGKYGNYEKAFSLLSNFLEKKPRDFYVWNSLYKITKEHKEWLKLYTFLQN